MHAFPQPEALSPPCNPLAVADVVTGWLRPGGPHTIGQQTAGWGAAEWASARKATLVHGIAPLLAVRLAGTPAWARLAPALQQYCTEQLALNRHRLRLILDDLTAILSAAADAGVAVVPLKGAALALQFYAEPALRPMADLDLLVRPEHAERMGAAMGRLGFRLVEDTPRHRAYLRGELSVASWDGEHPDNPRGVEVHSRVGERLRAINYDITDAMWRGVTTGSYAGMLSLALRPDALLHHLLIHTCHNMLNRRLRLIQLVDIALVAPTVEQKAWQGMVELALSLGEARLLYAPLALAEAVFGPLAPEAISAALAQATPPGLRRLLQQTTPSGFSLCAPGPIAPGFRLAWYRPGRERLGAIARVLLPAADELRQRYPGQRGGLPAAYIQHLGHILRWALQVAAMGKR